MAQAGLSDEKRRLLDESERYRQVMTAEFRNAKAATAWVPTTIGVMRAVSPLVALSAPVLGFLWRKKKHYEPKHERDGKPKGMVGMTLLAFELLRKARPFFESFRRLGNRSARKPATHTQAPVPRT